jgi:hypothetical protein
MYYYTRLFPGAQFTAVKPIEEAYTNKNIIKESTGYIAYPINFVKKPSKYNQRTMSFKAITKLVLLRKGKNGKDRLDKLKVNVAVVINENILKNKNLLATCYGTTTLLSCKFIPKNQLETSKLDFLGWATAKTLLIKDLITKSKNKNKLFTFNLDLIDNISSNFNENNDILNNITLNFRQQIISDIVKAERHLHPYIKNINNTITYEESDRLSSLYQWLYNNNIEEYKDVKIKMKEMAQQNYKNITIL